GARHRGLDRGHPAPLLPRAVDRGDHRAAVRRGQRRRVPGRPDRARPGPVRAHDPGQPGRAVLRGALRAPGKGGMMAHAANSLAQAVDLREPSGWRRTKNQIMTVLMWVALVLIV